MAGTSAAPFVTMETSAAPFCGRRGRRPSVESICIRCGYVIPGRRSRARNPDGPGNALEGCRSRQRLERPRICLVSVLLFPHLPGIGLAIPARAGSFVRRTADGRRWLKPPFTAREPAHKKTRERCFQAPAIHPVIRPSRPPEVTFTAFSPDTGGERQPAVETAGDRLFFAADNQERWLKPPPSVFFPSSFGRRFAAALL